MNTSFGKVTILVLALCAGQALAARCYVTPAATGDGSGDSWANAKTNIQAAIDVVYAGGEAKSGSRRVSITRRPRSCSPIRWRCWAVFRGSRRQKPSTTVMSIPIER